MTSLDEAADECEVASGPDRSLDGMIAHAVGCSMPGDPVGWPPRYTGSLDAAMTLKPENWCIDAGTGGAPYILGPWARCYPEGVGQSAGIGNRNAATMALAICSAALRAIGLNQQIKPSSDLPSDS